MPEIPDWPNSFVTYRCIVLPQHCDHYGHLNVRFYANFFDDGGFQMWGHAGIKQSDLIKDGMGAVVANISIDFVNEITAGFPVVIKGAWTKIGTKSVAHEQRMYNADTGVHCASQTTVEVFFDMQKRQSAPMPEDIRAKIEPLVAGSE